MNDWFHKEREQSGGEYGRNEFLYRYLIIAAAFLLICAVYTVSAFRIHAVYGNSEDIGNEEYANMLSEKITGNLLTQMAYG
jgi:hypothetical protein